VLRRHPVLSLATAVYLAALFYLTLTPSSTSDQAFSILRRVVSLLQRHDATDWVTFPLAEFAANILLFVPMGVFVVLLLGRRMWWAGLFAGFIGSCWIELAQGVWLPSRVSDPRDLVSNTLGTLLGVLLALLITWPAAHRDRRRTVGVRSARRARA
jgi:glycopeptide antibiotics resistance protein